MEKLQVGILGATGMVGQRFITLLNNHPWFEVAKVAASPRSAGKNYAEAVEGRWAMDEDVPSAAKDLVLSDASDIEAMQGVAFVFSALDMDKEDIKKLEEAYAAADIPVVSNNSAHRWTDDVPMIIPEINPEHTDLIDIQKKNRGWDKGFIAVKSNCSIQSYIPAIKPLMEYKPTKMLVTTMQAISGAGKTFESWPEMEDNVIPHIGGENTKSEKEPLKVLGTIEESGLKEYEGLTISAQCNRVAALDGHMADVAVAFESTPSKEDIVNAWKTFKTTAQELSLPSAPDPFLIYTEEEGRPSTKEDRDAENGMAVTLGNLREDTILDFRFTGLSHNTIRGAAGGAILLAELLKAKGYL